MVKGDERNSKFCNAVEESGAKEREERESVQAASANYSSDLGDGFRGFPKHQQPQDNDDGWTFVTAHVELLPTGCR